MSYRILALDIDGTILDPHGSLPEAVRDAVASARQHGLRVILCTGRRFRTALPWARELGLDGAIVVNNGTLIKQIESGETLRHSYLPLDEYAPLISFVRRRGSPLVYVDTYHENVDLVTERCSLTHEFQREYLNDNTAFFRTIDDLHAEPRSDVIMVSTMGDEETLGLLREEASEQFGSRVRTHSLINKNYRGMILEFLSPHSGKWAALSAIAADAGVAAEQIIAVGDDTNDIEMIRNAGLGIAMGNAAAEVKQAADHVVRSNAEGGVVEAIRKALLLL
ncbi:MAG TPA: Cof-type HAD-IIB family hydrolase [Myxococcota bacterium]|nr:Cof-type HAD-IIB family hydrolase [Myxococcota bacterium]